MTYENGGNVREWYLDAYGEEDADGIPEELTWNGLLLALSSGNVQNIVPDGQVRERCIWKLSETCRVDIDTLTKIGGTRS